MHLTRVDFEVFWNPASEEHFDATTASISLYKALTRILINDLKVLVRGANDVDSVDLDSDQVRAGPQDGH